LLHVAVSRKQIDVARRSISFQDINQKTTHPLIWLQPFSGHNAEEELELIHDYQNAEQDDQNKACGTDQINRPRREFKAFGSQQQVIWKEQDRKWTHNVTLGARSDISSVKLMNGMATTSLQW
jgi:hypothetical protein